MSSRASTALLERIRALAAAQFGGADDIVVATPPVSSLLHEEHVAVLADARLGPVDDPEQLRAVVDLLGLLDCVQDGSTTFVGPGDRSERLGDTYSRVVANAEFRAAGVDPAKQAEYDAALAVLYVDPPFQKTPAYEQFTALRSELERTAVLRLELTAQLSSLDAGPEREQVEQALARATEAEATTRRLVDALDLEHSFQEAESVRRSAGAQIGGVPPSVAQALASFELWQLADPGSGRSHPQCDLVPSRVVEDNWVSVVLDEAQLAAAPDVPDASVGTDDVMALPEDRVDGVEAQVQILAVDRAWFWRGLFDNRHWDWRTPSPPVSTGGQPGEALIPAYVTGLVLARNLVVRGSVPPAGEEPAAAERPFVRFANILTAAPPARGTRPVIAVRGSLRDVVRTSRPVLRPGGPVVRDHRRRGSGVAAPDGPPVWRPDRPGRPLWPLPGVLAAGSLDVVVTDADGRALAGAAVELVAAGQQQGMSRSTEATGSTTFEGLLPGDHTVTVRKAGFAPSTVSVAVRGRASSTVTLTPLAPAEPLLTVRLRDPQGDPPVVPRGAVVVRDSGGTEVRREPIGPSAELAVRLPAGSYAVEVVAPGARSVAPSTADVVLSRDHVLEVVVDSGVLLFNGDLHLVGFVCRRVPRCPDPTG